MVRLLLNFMKNKPPSFSITNTLFKNTNSFIYNGLLNNKECIIKKQNKKYFRKDELLVLKKVKNDDDFCQLLDYYISENHVYLFLQKYEKDMLHYLQEKQYLEIDTVVNHIKTISWSLIKLKQLGYYHVDIKPTNLFMYENKVILGDFDLATKTTEVGKPYIFGTVQYIAPEIDISHVLHDNSDVYSLGVTFITLLSNSLPNPETNSLFISPNKLLKHLLITRGDIPEYIYNLIENMLVFNPHHRYNVESVHKLLK